MTDAERLPVEDVPLALELARLLEAEWAGVHELTPWYTAQNMRRLLATLRAHGYEMIALAETREKRASDDDRYCPDPPCEHDPPCGTLL